MGIMSVRWTERMRRLIAYPFDRLWTRLLKERFEEQRDTMAGTEAKALTDRQFALLMSVLSQAGCGYDLRRRWDDCEHETASAPGWFAEADSMRAVNGIATVTVGAGQELVYEIGPPPEDEIWRILLAWVLVDSYSANDAKLYAYGRVYLGRDGSEPLERRAPIFGSTLTYSGHIMNSILRVLGPWDLTYETRNQHGMPVLFSCKKDGEDWVDNPTMSAVFRCNATGVADRVWDIGAIVAKEKRETARLSLP